MLYLIKKTSEQKLKVAVNKKEEFIGQTGQLKSFIVKPLTLETKVTYIESRFPIPYKLNINL